jgi:hypothetical protein
MSVLYRFWIAREKWLINFSYRHSYQMYTMCFMYLSSRSAYEFQKRRYLCNNWI